MRLNIQHMFSNVRLPNPCPEYSEMQDAFRRMNKECTPENAMIVLERAFSALQKYPTSLAIYKEATYCIWIAVGKICNSQHPLAIQMQQAVDQSSDGGMDIARMVSNVRDVIYPSNTKHGT